MLMINQDDLYSYNTVKGLFSNRNICSLMTLLLLTERQGTQKLITIDNDQFIVEYPNTYELRLGKKDTDNIPECWFWVSEWCPGLDPGVGKGVNLAVFTLAQTKQYWYFQRETWAPPPPRDFLTYSYLKSQWVK